MPIVQVDRRGDQYMLMHLWTASSLKRWDPDGDSTGNKERGLVKTFYAFALSWGVVTSKCIVGCTSWPEFFIGTTIVWPKKFYNVGLLSLMLVGCLVFRSINTNFNGNDEWFQWIGYWLFATTDQTKSSFLKHLLLSLDIYYEFQSQHDVKTCKPSVGLIELEPTMSKEGTDGSSLIS